MNQSKCTPIGYAVILLVFFLLLFYGVWEYIPGKDGSFFSWDAKYYYVNCIESGEVTNWHSELFMYECIFLRWLIHETFGELLSGLEILRVVWWISFFMLSGCVGYVLCCLMNRHKAYLISLFAFPLFITMLIRETPLGLDFFFFCVLVLSLFLLFKYNNVRNIYWKIVVGSILLCLLWHMVSYRKNAVVLLPLFFYGALMSWNLFEKMPVKRLIVSVVVSIFFVLITFPMVSAFLPVIRQYPVIPMLASDERIILNLHGNQESKDTIFNLPEHSKYTIAASAGGSIREATYKEMGQAYVQLCLNSPQDVLVARSVQIIQFYCGGNTPAVVKMLIERGYPAVSGNKAAWNKLKYQQPSDGMVVFRICIFVAGIIVLVCGIRVFFNMSSIEKYSLFSVLVSLCYAMSFCICAPTPDARYLSCSVVIILASIVVLLGHVVAKLCTARRDVINFQ